MKSAFIRMMAVAVLAASISAFASENPKAARDSSSGGTNAGTAVESNPSLTIDELLQKVDQLQAQVQQLEDKDKQNQRDQQMQQEDMNKKIHQQEKEWNNSLLGIYGG
jgi:TolA-binding protein